MSEHITPPQANSEEISLRELLLKTRNMIRYVLRYWILLVLLGLIGGVIGYLKAREAQPTYTAELTFVVDDAKSNTSAYSGIASSFGIDLGGGGSAGLYQGENVVEFLKSRFMVQKALLTSYPGDTTRSMADKYFELTGLKASWDAQERTKGVHFRLRDNSFSRMQDSALGILGKRMSTTDLTVDRTNKKMGFFIASCTSTDEVFAKAFVDNLVKKATDFYVEAKTKRSKTNVDNLQREADSLTDLLNRKTYAAAFSQDLNPNPARRVATVGVEMSNRDKLIVQTLYTEVIKNLAAAKMTLAQDMPIIQLIDTPVLPLIIQKKSKLNAALIWGFSFGFAGLFILIVRKLLRSVRL